MLCVYQALRHLTADTASRAGLPVTHISFNNALAAVRRTVGTDFPPRKLAAKLADVQTDLTAPPSSPAEDAPRPAPPNAAAPDTDSCAPTSPQPLGSPTSSASSSSLKNSGRSPRQQA